MKHPSRKMSGCMHPMMEKMRQERMGPWKNGENQSTTAEMEYGSAELKALFSDWLLQLEEEVVLLAGKENKISAEKMMAEFKLSRESAEFILQKLVRQGRITINEERSV